MLTEEALVVLAAIGACGLLLMGVLELLWPTRPKHPVRRRPVPAPPSDRRGGPYSRGREAAHGPARRVRRAAPAMSAPATADLGPTAIDSTRGSVTAAAPPGAPGPAVADSTTDAPADATLDCVVETCFALSQSQRYADVLAVAGTALDGEAARARLAPRERAALWSVVALARQGLGDHAAARAALERAIAEAPAGEHVIYAGQLAALAVSVARGLLTGAHAGPASAQRVTALREALAWIACGQAAAPADTAFAALAARAREALWPAYEHAVVALVQRQEFGTARRLLREALVDPLLPAGRGDKFRALLSGTFSGEIGQLTAAAVRSMQEAREVDALASLQRAAELLDTLHAEALPPRRREEVNRRLWWGYQRLAARRLQSGEYEAALEPLFHARRFGAGSERQAETRGLLVRALEGVVDARGTAIRERADAGDREAARRLMDTLWSRLRGATGEGLSEDDLSAAFEKATRLVDTLGRAQG